MYQNVFIVGKRETELQKACIHFFDKTLNEGKPVVIFNHTGAFDDWVKEKNGTVIHLNKGFSINPFDICYLYKEENEVFHTLTSHILELAFMFEIIAGHSFDNEMSRLVSNAIEEFFFSHGLKRNQMLGEHTIPSFFEFEPFLRAGNDEKKRISLEIFALGSYKKHLFSNETLQLSNVTLFTFDYFDPLAFYLAYFYTYRILSRDIRSGLIALHELDEKYTFFTEKFRGISLVTRKFGYKTLYTTTSLQKHIKLYDESIISRMYHHYLLQPNKNDYNDIKNIYDIEAHQFEYLLDNEGFYISSESGHTPEKIVF
jgi:hypothetical protein